MIRLLWQKAPVAAVPLGDSTNNSPTRKEHKYCMNLKRQRMTKPDDSIYTLLYKRNEMGSSSTKKHNFLNVNLLQLQANHRPLMRHD